MITIWRRLDVTTMRDEKPRRVWSRVPDYEAARASNETARRNAASRSREDLRWTVREELDRAAIQQELRASLGPREAVRVERESAVPGRLWSIDIMASKVQFARFHPDGRVSEIYRPVSLREAAVWFAAIAQGFEPPRCLCAVDEIRAAVEAAAAKAQRRIRDVMRPGSGV